MAANQPKSPPDQPSREQVLAFIEEQGEVRTSDIVELGGNRMQLTRLTQEGYLERVGHGRYKIAVCEPLGLADVVFIAGKFKRSVLGLVTALYHYGLVTEDPIYVDILVPPKMRAPDIEDPPIRVFRASQQSFDAGIVEQEINGTQVRMTSPAKTVADCFKYRSRVGVYLAEDALRKGLAEGLFTREEFIELATINRAIVAARRTLAGC